jgi:hypothetical protein
MTKYSRSKTPTYNVLIASEHRPLGFQTNEPWSGIPNDDRVQLEREEKLRRQVMHIDNAKQTQYKQQGMSGISKAPITIGKVAPVVQKLNTKVLQTQATTTPAAPAPTPTINVQVQTAAVPKTQTPAPAIATPTYSAAKTQASAPAPAPKTVTARNNTPTPPITIPPTQTPEPAPQSLAVPVLQKAGVSTTPAKQSLISTESKTLGNARTPMIATRSTSPVVDPTQKTHIASQAKQSDARLQQNSTPPSQSPTEIQRESLYEAPVQQLQTQTNSAVLQTGTELTTQPQQQQIFDNRQTEPLASKKSEWSIPWFVLFLGMGTGLWYAIKKRTEA